jgi:hypothetical protein
MSMTVIAFSRLYMTDRTAIERAVYTKSAQLESRAVYSINEIAANLTLFGLYSLAKSSAIGRIEIHPPLTAHSNSFRGLDLIEKLIRKC